MKSLEIARFKAIDSPELLTTREACMRAVAQTFPAFVSERLVRFEDGTFADEIVWASREEADRAAAEVPALPEAQAYFGLITEVVSMEHAQVISA